MPPDASQYRIHMACVPGGKVIANDSGSPAAFALSANGLTAAGVRAPALFNLLLSVIACPFRLRSHGITIGFTGDPARPIVEASGIPISMCVAWLSPIESLSRMTAHEASFDTGLDVLGLKVLRLPSTARLASQLLRGRTHISGKQVTTVHDVYSFVLRAERPLAFQLDGDYLGERGKVEFVAVPEAVRVVC